MDFITVRKDDMAKRGWSQLDFIFVSGDAYVDHPGFGPAILCRLLEKHGPNATVAFVPFGRYTVLE